jgi:oligoendopeptidase F
MSSLEQTSCILSLPDTEQIWTKPILTEDTSGTFLPCRFLFLGWDALESFFEELRKRPVLNADDCERWLRDLTDLEDQMHLAYQHLHTLQVVHPDEQATATFEHNLSNHEILWETARQALYERLMEFPWFVGSELGDMRRLRSVIGSRASTFSWFSYSIENQIERLEHSLHKLEEELDSQVAALLPEEASDKEYWLLNSQKRLELQGDLDSVARAMLEAYRELAQSKGSSDMLECALRAQDSIDYTPDDVIKVSHRILERFGPLARRCKETRARQAGIERVRPWHDLDGAEIPYLPTLAQSATLESTLLEALSCISPLLQEIFVHNRERFVINPYQSDTKAGGAFIAEYPRMNKLLLSCDLDGSAGSLTELFHEVTHLIHGVVANQHQAYYWYRTSPPEISEGLAMAVELLATQAYPLFFKAPLVRQARCFVLEEAITSLVEAALNTAYEVEVHRQPNPSFSQIWIDLSNKANTGIDWQKLYSQRRLDYLETLDLIKAPFADINYMFGGLISLQLYADYQRDSTATVHRVLETMKAGDSLPLPELYAILGVPFLTNTAAIDQLAAEAERLLSSAWKTRRRP